jgi:uncharacterized protein YecT (DUF1311 family)
MKHILFAAACLAAFPGVALADDMSDITDWCAKATRPSSVVICSDPELRRMAVIRNKIMGDARAHFSPEDMQEFSRDQNNWIHEYTASCGADTNGPAINPPIKPEIIDCYRRAGRDRVAEMVRAVREVVADYKAPVIDGNPSQPPVPKDASLPASPPKAASLPAPPLSLDEAWHRIEKGSDWHATDADFDAYIRIVSADIPQKQERLNSLSHQCESRMLPFCVDGYLQHLRDEISQETIRKSNAETTIANIHQKRETEARQAAETEETRQFQATLDGKIGNATAQGYKLVTVRDFVVDGASLADDRSRVIIKGAFVSENATNGYLIVGDFNSTNKVELLFEDADRDTRMMLAKCADEPIGPYGIHHGCNVVFLAGTATSCTVSFIGQHVRDQACLKVETGFRADRG